MSKVCRDCKLTKELSEFRINNIKRKDGTSYPRHTTYCKDCGLKIQREYKAKNKERLKKRDAEYRKNNLEKLNATAKKYISNNREKRNAYIREYKKKKKESDPSYSIYENCRKRIWKVLRVNKKNSTNELLGCSKRFYEMWINFTLINQDVMNWNNYGKYWDIDHVVPINSFDIQNEQKLKECFNWRNTRALDKEANYKKKDKIDDEYINNHQKDLQEFDKIIKFKNDLKWAIRSRASEKSVEGSETRVSKLKVKVIG